MLPGRTFVQQKFRGPFPSNPVCFFCEDAGQEDVEYEERKAFMLFPTYRLKPGYVRDEEKDPKPLLDAKRKNATPRQQRRRAEKQSERRQCIGTL